MTNFELHRYIMPIYESILINLVLLHMTLHTKFLFHDTLAFLFHTDANKAIHIG